MADDDEFSKDLEPNALIGVQPTITGPPGANLSENPVVKVRERRWLNRFKKVKRTIRRPKRTELGQRRRMRDGGLCWDEALVVEDVEEVEGEETLEKYEDWEFEIAFDDFRDWVSLEGVRVTVAPDAQIPVEGLSFGRKDITTVDDRTVKPGTEHQVGSTDWAVIDTRDLGPPRLIERGTPQWVAVSKKEECRDEPATGSSTTESAQFKALDLDTGKPVKGTIEIPGVSQGPKTITDEQWGWVLNTGTTTGSTRSCTGPSPGTRWWGTPSTRRQRTRSSSPSTPTSTASASTSSTSAR